MIRSIGVFFLLLFFNSLQAQLCTGSLGDPIVHFTFGQGSNPGPALSSAITNYSYVSNDCPNDGFYTIRTSTAGCFGNTWHTVSADHTGNSGYFMLVNASIQPGAFYIDTVKGLCGGMTYEFATWVMNVILPSACSGNSTRPDLTLTIERTDGTILRSYNTGSISTTSNPTWNQYGSFFTTPVGVTEVVLRIVNNAPGGCGNDLALDDITFRPCGPVITGSIDGVQDYDTSFCQGETRNFIFNCNLSGGFSNPVYQWQRRIAPQANWTDIPAANAQSLPVSFIPTTSPGLYQFRLAVAESGNMGSTSCRVYSKPFDVTIHATPVTTAANNGPACVNSNVSLSATGGATYSWTGPSGYTATSNPATITGVQLTHAGKYYVLVTSAAGCTNLDSTILVVNPVPVAGASVDKPTICFKDSAQLSASGGVSYQWIPPVGLSNATIANPKASPAQTTTYSAIVSNSFSCKDTADITLTVIPKPVANAGPDKIIFVGQSVQLSGAVSGEISSFQWSPPDYMDDVNALQPTVNPPADQLYTLTAISDFGCGTASDQVFIKVFKDIFIPTGFTPDNNGRNDYWKVLGVEALTEYKISVYNRWGERVFYTHNDPKGWDGTFKGMPAPAGIYIYVMERGTEKTLLKGTIVLIR